jgi:hypothetical protein
VTTTTITLKEIKSIFQWKKITSCIQIGRRKSFVKNFIRKFEDGGWQGYL